MRAARQGCAVGHRFRESARGWNGTYRLAKAGESEDRTLVKFQQYYGGFPILNTPGFQYGVMELDLQQGTVTSYERSLLYLESVP